MACSIESDKSTAPFDASDCATTSARAAARAASLNADYDTFRGLTRRARPRPASTRVVLRLRQHLHRDDARVRCLVGDHQQLARAGRRIDRHRTRDLQLRLGDVRVPGPTMRSTRGTVSVPNAIAAIAPAPPMAKSSVDVRDSRRGEHHSSGTIPCAPPASTTTTVFTPATRAGMAPMSTLLGYAARPPGA